MDAEARAMVAEIEARAKTAEAQCMCGVCVLDNERRHPVDCIECERSREYHNREDIPALLAVIRALKDGT